MKSVLNFILASLLFVVAQSSFAGDLNPSCAYENQCAVLKTYGPGVWPLKTCQPGNMWGKEPISYLYVFKDYFLVLKSENNHYTMTVLDKNTCEELRRGEIITVD